MRSLEKYRVDKSHFPKIKEEPISIVLPFMENGNDPKRRLNLNTTISYYRKILPNSQIVVVEQYENNPSFSDKNVSKVYLKKSGPANRSTMLNAGWCKSKNDIVLFCDNDYVLRKDVIKIGSRLISQGLYDIFKPYDIIYNFPESFDQINADLENANLNICTPENEYIALTGGAFLTSKSFYEKIGGFDEGFVGWGGEDDASSLIAVDRGRYIAYESFALHLYHKKALSNKTPEFMKAWQKNIDRLQDIRKMNDVEFDNYINLLRENLKKYKDI